MDHYNGEHTGNDKEALEALRQEAYEALRLAHSTSPLRLSVNILDMDDVQAMFPELAFVGVSRPWMEKRMDIGDFRLHAVNIYSEGNSAMIKVHLDVILDFVFSEVQLRKSQVRFENYCQCSFQPVTYKGCTYRLSGVVDYTGYKGQDRTAVKLVVIRAKKLGFRCCSGKPRVSCCGHAKMIALMAMIHYYRKAHGEANCAVYGVATDSIDFKFYKIDNNSEVSFFTLSANVRPLFIDYQEVTGLLAYIFNEAFVLSQDADKQSPNRALQVRFEDELSLGTLIE